MVRISPCILILLTVLQLSWNRDCSFMLSVFSFFSFFSSFVLLFAYFSGLLQRTLNRYFFKQHSFPWKDCISYLFFSFYCFYLLCRNIWSSEWLSIIPWMPQSFDFCSFPLQCTKAVPNKFPPFPLLPSPSHTLYHSVLVCTLILDSFAWRQDF